MGVAATPVIWMMHPRGWAAPLVPVTVHPVGLAVRTSLATIHPPGATVHAQGVTAQPAGWTVPRPGEIAPKRLGVVRELRAAGLDVSCRPASQEVSLARVPWSIRIARRSL